MLVNGSVYDLAALYIKLIVKHDIEDKMGVVKQFASILDNGYTYEIILRDILNAFYSNTPLNFNKYSSPCGLNLLKQGVMYYHKELKIINKLPVVVHDIDAGTLTSTPTEFFVEPRASYTLDDLTKYFCSKEMTDMQEYPIKRLQGILKHMVDKYGIDKVLFMIEACSRMFNAEKKWFSISDFDSYNSTASHYIEESRNNCTFSGEMNYVPRKRVLFN